jgi:hypothetical protein
MLELPFQRFGPGGDANRSFESARIPISQGTHHRDPRDTQQVNLRQNVELTRTYTCSACGEMIMGAILLDHLGEAHHNECIPFACSECGYQAISQRKVHRHIAHKHPTNVANITVKVLSAGVNDMLFLQKFFPEIVSTTTPENQTAEKAVPKALESEVAKCEVSSLSL